MNSIVCLSFAVVSFLALGYPTAAAAAEEAKLAACIDAGVAELIASHSREFSSPQYRVVCKAATPPECQRQDRDETFTFEAPDGFRIDAARFDITSQTVRTSVGALSADGSQAEISLQCTGRACGKWSRVYVAGVITGRLAYQPTKEEIEAIAARCLEQITD